MNTIKLKTGMASKFFVSDVETMTVAVEQPYLVLSRKEFSSHALAEILVIVNEKNKISGFFNSFRKKFTVQECAANLFNLYDYEGRKVELPVINRGMVIFSPGIDKKTLVIMKMLKVKGMIGLLAVQSGEVDSLEAIRREAEGQKVKDTLDASIYGPVNFNIVSGIKETIISQQKAKQILKEFPEAV